jgi:hypothetical protein
MTTMMTKEEAIAFYTERLSELEKAIAAREKERSALQVLLEKEAKNRVEHITEEEIPSDNGDRRHSRKRIRKQTPSQTPSQSPTATELLKKPNLGVKGSLMQALAKKKPKNSDELIQEIVKIKKTDPYYKGVANSIRQSLRSAVKNGDIQAYRDGKVITYGVAK